MSGVKAFLVAAMLLWAGAAREAAAEASEAAASRATRDFQEGNGAYERNDYAKAADLYRKAVDEGIINSRLFYNYANALFRQGQLGLAILYYEKARKLEPTDEDIAYNLRFANAQTVDKNPAPETNILTKVLWSLHTAYSIDQGLWICLGLFSAIFLAAMLAVFSGAGLRGVLFALMGLCVVALLVLGPSLAYKIRQQESVEYGIVLKPAVEMYSGPGENFQVLTKVHEGTKFQIVETRGDWVSVKLLNGKGGYVRYADLGKV
jgi:tetratricopeptide (TPR) repeat protein